MATLVNTQTYQPYECMICGDAFVDTRAIFIDFPIQCECCEHTNHQQRIDFCEKCIPQMLDVTWVKIDTKKLLDPIHEGLFTKKVKE